MSGRSLTLPPALASLRTEAEKWWLARTARERREIDVGALEVHDAAIRARQREQAVHQMREPVRFLEEAADDVAIAGLVVALP